MTAHLMVMTSMRAVQEDCTKALPAETATYKMARYPATIPHGSWLCCLVSISARLSAVVIDSSRCFPQVLNANAIIEPHVINYNAVYLDVPLCGPCKE
jgi:hypothetical protein